MALIQCPECEKTISDRAKICPNCGFPINEFLEEKRMQEEENNLLKRKKDLLQLITEKHVFNFFNKQIFLTKNDVICSKIEECITISFDNAIDVFFNNYKTSKPSEFSERDLAILVKTNYTEVARECLESVGQLNEFILSLVDENLIIGDWDYLPIDIDTYFNEINDVFYQLRKESLNIEYQLTQNADSIVNEYKNGNVIDSVYSSSVGGLIKQSIKANIINGISNSFSNSKMKKELGKIDKEQNSLQNSFDNEIFKMFINASNNLIAFVYDALITHYSNLGIMIELNNYSKNESSLESLKELLSNPLTLQSKKIECLFKSIINQPTNIAIYEYCVDYLIFQKNEIDEFEKLLHFVKQFDPLLRKSNGKIKYSIDGKNCKLLNIDDITFELLSDKECYIRDKITFEKSLLAFFDERQWFDPDKLQTNYQRIISLGTPESPMFKEMFRILDETYNFIQNHYTKFSLFMLKALKTIKSDYNVMKFLNYIKDNEQIHNFNLFDGELPIKYYKYGSMNSDNEYSQKHGLLITTMRMAITYTYNDEILYSFFPTKEYVKEFITTDNSIILKSPAKIKFVNNVSYKKDVQKNNSFNNTYDKSFSTDVGVLRKRSDDNNILENFTEFYKVLQQDYVNKSFDVSDYSVKNVDIYQLPYTVVLANLDKIDKSTEEFNIWYDNNEKILKDVHALDEFRVDKLNKTKEINKAETEKLRKEFDNLIVSLYPDFFDKINFVNFEALNNRSQNARQIFDILIEWSNLTNDEDIDLMYYLGLSHCYGLGTIKNYRVADYYFTKILDLHSEAIYHLWYIYVNDQTLTPKDFNWINFMIYAADKGSLNAKLCVCTWFETNAYGLEINASNRDTIYSLEQELASKGCRSAKFLIVRRIIFEDNNPSYDNTINELLSILDNHTPNDSILIGLVYEFLFVCFSNDKIIGQNNEKIAEYLILAAENESIFCQRVLGEYYLNREDGLKDVNKAIFWFEKAAAKGDKISKDYIKKLTKKRWFF